MPVPGTYAPAWNISNSLFRPTFFLYGRLYPVALATFISASNCPYYGRARVERGVSEPDECDMGEGWYRLDISSSEKTMVILGDRWLSQRAKQDGDNMGKKFLCNCMGKRIERPNVGGVSVRSRNGAPSRKGCVVNGQMSTMYTCIAPPTKKMIFRRFFEQIHDWKHLYLCICFCTTSRHSATTPATPLIRNAPPGDGLLGALTTVWQSDSSFRAL